LAVTRERGRQLEAYVVSRIAELFPKAHLVRQNEILPGGNIVDLHLQSANGQDIFVEIKGTPIKKTYLKQLVDYYTAISNLEPPPKSFKIVLIGETIDTSLEKELEGLNTEFVPLKDISFLQQKHLRQIQLSPIEARLVVALESRKTKLVTPTDIARLLNRNREYSTVLLHRLERKKWVDRISKGKYVFVPAAAGYGERFPSLNPLLAGSALVSPYYYSYSTANAYYGLSTQLPTTVYLATTAKKPQFMWKNTYFKFVTLQRRKFFGFTKVKVQTAEVNIAELEKAVVDSVDKPDYSGGIEGVLAVIYRAYRRIDIQRIVDYAIRMKTRVICQRLGFLLDFLASKDLVNHLTSDLRDKLLSGTGKSPLYIGPKEGGGHYLRDWHVVKTLPDRELLSEIEVT